MGVSRYGLYRELKDGAGFGQNELMQSLVGAP
jgi:hypothetical protein